MKKVSKILFILFGMAICLSCSKSNVRFVENIENKKVDVYFGENYFTSYLYPENMVKQVLYPIFTASGKDITRGYPVNPKPFERTDHPHHVGFWFNFGDVNGLDFWNNSPDIKPENKPQYGSIKFKEIIEINQGTGTLATLSDWVDYNDEVLLNEASTYIFSEQNGIRSIQRTIELTAQIPVTFTDNKEGMLGLRMDRTFEDSNEKSGRFLDSKGNMTEVPVQDNGDANGVYRNAEGDRGGEVWGKRSPWVALRAEKEGEVITVAILDHPGNPNYPGWSHARGYGLFALNNFAGRAVDKNAEPVKIELNPGEKIVFKYKVIIGGDLTDRQIIEIDKNFKK
jgi:hypothetical protein